MKKSTLLKYLEYAAQCDLKSKDYKVLLYVLSEIIDFESSVINQNNVADELGITKSDVSKSLRRLEKNRIIYFNWLSERKKFIGLVEYKDNELKDLINEKIDERTRFIPDWDDE